MTPHTVCQWFEQLPELLLEGGWNKKVEEPKGALCHRKCPWGGQLLRLCTEISVQDMPQNPADLLVRPEVRAIYGQSAPEMVDAVQLVEHLAPGQALVQQLHSWGLNSLCSILVGDSEKDFSAVAKTTQNVYRDFPREGDSVLCSSGGCTSLLLLRPLDRSRVDAYGFISLSEEQFESWSFILLKLLCDSWIRMAQWAANRPGISLLRAMDQEFYTVLTVQSCRRGLPLVPCGLEEADVTIEDGREMGLACWKRFVPTRYGEDRFSLAHYLKTFMASLGVNCEAWPSVDGRSLLSFQCAMPKQQWQQLKDRFLTCFLFQKKAYRRLNGGSTAPSLRPDQEPRYFRDATMERLGLRTKQLEEIEASKHRVMVRNTFLEVDDPQPVIRCRRKHRTTGDLVGETRLELQDCDLAECL